jgi:hypothetical protein
MADNNCANCGLRKKYDNKPRSILGRFWRWHIGFCPGWKAYMKSLDDNQREDIIKQYKLKRV